MLTIWRNLKNHVFHFFDFFLFFLFWEKPAQYEGLRIILNSFQNLKDIFFEPIQPSNECTMDGKLANDHKGNLFFCTSP